MNEDKITGVGRNLLGKAELAVGDTVGSEKLEGRGGADQVGGAIQHGYGELKGGARSAIDDAPGVIRDVAELGRELGRRADAAIRRQLGDNGTFYVLAGAVAVFALGLFAAARSESAAGPTPHLRARKPKA